MVKPPFCITNYKQQRNYYYLDNTLTGSGPIADGNLPKKNTTTMQHMLGAGLQIILWLTQTSLMLDGCNR